MLLDAESSYYTAQCCDVSQAGLGVETQARLIPGTRLDVYFELPTGAAIEARASVARIAPNKIGLRFLEIGPESAAALREYCEGWRLQLLQQCAARAASARSVRIASQPPVSVRAPSQPPVSVRSPSQPPVSVRSPSQPPVSVRAPSQPPIGAQSQSPVSVPTPAESPYDSFECKSEVRVRVAPIIPVTNERKA